LDSEQADPVEPLPLSKLFATPPPKKNAILLRNSFTALR